MLRPRDWHFTLSAVDRAGVPWDVAFFCDPIAGLDARDSYAAEFPGLVVMLMDDDAIDLDAHYLIDSPDDELVEKWLNKQDDSKLTAICAGKHGVTFCEDGGEFDRDFVIEFILCDGNVAA